MWQSQLDAQDILTAWPLAKLAVRTWVRQLPTSHSTWLQGRPDGVGMVYQVTLALGSFCPGSEDVVLPREEVVMMVMTTCAGSTPMP
jgi:hypothetical protein